MYNEEEWKDDAFFPSATTIVMMRMAATTMMTTLPPPTMQKNRCKTWQVPKRYHIVHKRIRAVDGLQYPMDMHPFVQLHNKLMATISINALIVLGRVIYLSKVLFRMASFQQRVTLRYGLSAVDLCWSLGR